MRLHAHGVVTHPRDRHSRAIVNKANINAHIDRLSKLRNSGRVQHAIPAARRQPGSTRHRPLIQVQAPKRVLIHARRLELLAKNVSSYPGRGISAHPSSLILNVSALRHVIPPKQKAGIIITGNEQGAFFAGLELRKVDRRLKQLPKNRRLVVAGSSDRASEGKLTGPRCRLHRSPQLNLPRRTKRVQLINNHRRRRQSMLHLAVTSDTTNQTIRIRTLDRKPLLVIPKIKNWVRTSVSTTSIKDNTRLIPRPSRDDYVRGMLTLNRSKIQRQGTKQARLAILTRQPNKGLPSLTTAILINSQQLSNQSALPRLERKRLPKPTPNSMLNVLTAPRLKMLSRQHLPALPHRPGLPLSNRAINSLQKITMAIHSERAIALMLFKTLSPTRRHRLNFRVAHAASGNMKGNSPRCPRAELQLK